MARPIVKDGKIKVMPYSIAELASVYEVCERTFKKWISPFADEIGEKQGRYFNISQVMIIIEKLGLPTEIPLDN